MIIVQEVSCGGFGKERMTMRFWNEECLIKINRNKEEYIEENSVWNEVIWRYIYIIKLRGNHGDACRIAVFEVEMLWV